MNVQSPASEPGRFDRYFVADSAPYFLAVETIDRDEEGNERQSSSSSPTGRPAG